MTHAPPTGPPEGLLADLTGAGLVVVTDPAVIGSHGVDWTGRWTGPVLGLVRPRTTSEVVAVLDAAHRAAVPVQVQGGNTGLVGGSVPHPDRPSLVLLTTGLDRLDPISEPERTVVVGAGVTVARLAAHARSAGLRFGVDLAARDTATVGGLAATNAGGMAVCAFGMMRDNVRGITAVLADGRVISTIGRPRKDNCGYDLAGVLVGSEGTLGVITEVEVVLHPEPPTTSVALLGVADLAEAVAAARAVQSGTSPLLSAEVVDGPGVARAAAALGRPDPLPEGAAWLLLLEVADGGTADGFAAVADQVVAVGATAVERQRLWAYRERQTELYAQLPGSRPEKLDVSFRLDRLDEGVAAVRAVVASRESSDEAWVGIFGHVLDGNLHVQLVGAQPGTADAILSEVARLGGSISAEHGIGRLKAGHLDQARSAEEIAWMRQLRRGVDPAGLLNPGVLLPDVDPPAPD